MMTAQGRTRRSPDGMWAGPGAVNQHGGKLPIYICNDCGTEVVWAESQRTGRKYLVNISHGFNGQRFYIGANVHKCEVNQERREAQRIAFEVHEDDANHAEYVLSLADPANPQWFAEFRRASRAEDV